MPSNKQFPALLEQYLQNNLSTEDEVLFVAMLKNGEYDTWLALDIQHKLEADYNELNSLNKQQTNKIMQAILEEQKQPAKVSVKQFNLQWWRYAAVVLVVVGVGLYALLHNRSVQQTNTDIIVHKEDVAPGGNRAILTLADGTTINLDSVQNGNLARQGNAEIIKLENGQIEYAVNATSESAIVLNTMSTPRGGQYKLILPDGSRVWLNAASSITYPTSFNPGYRNVKITGEAYFEIATVKTQHNDKANIPFYVDIDGKATIAVLGTHFNVNSYADEHLIKTTLLEGAVKITLPALNDKGLRDLRKEMTFNTKEAVLLRPGQQAIVSILNETKADKQSITVANEPDVDRVVAWKDGFFNFEQVHLETVMRQLARWYDVEVIYEGPLPNRYFEGKMDRGLTLSQVVKIFKETGVKFRLEGKKLYVSR